MIENSFPSTDWCNLHSANLVLSASHSFITFIWLFELSTESSIDHCCFDSFLHPSEPKTNWITWIHLNSQRIEFQISIQTVRRRNKFSIGFSVDYSKSQMVEWFSIGYSVNQPSTKWSGEIANWNFSHRAHWSDHLFVALTVPSYDFWGLDANYAVGAIKSAKS